MKKFFGGILSLLAFLCMIAAIALPTVGLMYWLFEQGKVDAIGQIFEQDWVVLVVCIAAAAFVVLLGTLVNNKLGKASYILSPIFALGLYGGLLYCVNWGFAKEISHSVLAVIPDVSLTNDKIYYIGIGVIVFGVILSFFGRRLYRKAVRESRRAKLQRDLAGDESYRPTSRDTDLAVTSSRTPKIERYVRDPWGNLIREEDYNERLNASRTKKL